MAAHNLNKSYIGLRKELLQFIKGKNNKILDLGCAIGSNGKYCLDNGIANEVIGIELDPVMAQRASESYSKVLIGNAQELISDPFFQTNYFDYILCGDILEHLEDPWNTLKLITTYLKPNGKIIVSLPNIQHIETFISIYIKGKWPYNESGIFDKTHLRFFTLKNINELVLYSGLKINHLSRIYRYRDDSSKRFPPHTRYILKKFKNLFTFQFILVCAKM